ncbi:UNVERIFIED_CONTAM: hypothetical protein HDU68_003550 [Siphonaria sp. JEL0065]|nr:hypothetical protein HDU68_003550 [Siphonaria sp. JEL0065]
MDLFIPPTYFARFTSIPPALDGKLDSVPWTLVPSTADFVDITGDVSKPPRFRSRAKILFDAEYLYFGCEMQEPHVWANITEKNSVIYWQNDWEIFVDPDGDGLNYYEFEINALNTIWELTMDKPYNKGGHATYPTNIEGLISAVHVKGTINDASDIDVGWNVEVAIPWAGLKKYNNPPTRSTPPKNGDSWRINFSRVEWKFRIDEATREYHRIPDENRYDVHFEDNWSWAPQGEINMHIPEKWGYVQFLDDDDM